jgi:Ca-activated chloride channel family protein
VVLPSTCASDRNAILGALDKLNAGGSTAGGAGITLAYKIAAENYVKGGTNRVILCTDGDFNVGIIDQGELRRILKAKAKMGIQLSIIGFGMGNYKDDMLEVLSNDGDGNYGYVDSFREAKKLFIRRLLGTLFMIAKDVKIQGEFNPEKVAAYRLIGYENRLLKAKDFKDDKVDAGDIGSGHTVTALYETVPPGADLPAGLTHESSAEI